MKTREWKREADFISRLLKKAPDIDREFRIGMDEFKMRQKKVFDGLQKAGFDCGLVFSNEHYDGDVPYLGGNINVAVEACAGVIGKNGFHIITGLEGGYVVEQLAPVPALESTRRRSCSSPTRTTRSMPKDSRTLLKKPATENRIPSVF